MIQHAAFKAASLFGVGGTREEQLRPSKERNTTRKEATALCNTRGQHSKRLSLLPKQALHSGSKIEHWARTTGRCCGPWLMVGKEGWKIIPLELPIIAAGCLRNSRYTHPQAPPSLSLAEMQTQIIDQAISPRELFRLLGWGKSQARLAPATTHAWDVLRFGKFLL